MKTIDQWFEQHKIKDDQSGIVLVNKELKRIAPHIEWETHGIRIYATNLQDKNLTFYVNITNVVYGYKVLYVCADYSGGSTNRYSGRSTPVEHIENLWNILKRTMDHFNIKTNGIVRQSLFDLEDNY